jgi:hypothetical protein
VLSKSTYEEVLAVSGSGASVHALAEQFLPIWCYDYSFTNPRAQLLLTELPDHGTSFSYLFDLEKSRIVVAFGIPVYRPEKRDAARIAGSFRMKDGKTSSLPNGYDRGHVMAHYLGGNNDINLVPQLSKINRGEFRKIEETAHEEAMRNFQCLYFVRCMYRGESQTPAFIEQCLVSPPNLMGYKLYSN